MPNDDLIPVKSLLPPKATMNAIVRAVRAMQAGNSVDGIWDGDRFIQRKPRTDAQATVYPVRLTARGSTPGFFQFTQLRWDATGGDWTTSGVVSPVTHSTLGEARETSGRMLIPLNQPVVYITASRFMTTISGVPIWEFTSPRQGILGRITGHLADAANATYRYAFTEVYMNGSHVTQDVSGGITATTSSGFAVNLFEVGNTIATAIGGDGILPSAAAYPTNFKRRPIGAGFTTDTHTFDVVVEITERMAANGTAARVFAAVNPHGGTC